MLTLNLDAANNIMFNLLNKTCAEHSLFTIKLLTKLHKLYLAELTNRYLQQFDKRVSVHLYLNIIYYNSHNIVNKYLKDNSTNEETDHVHNYVPSDNDTMFLLVQWTSVAMY